MQRPGPGLDPNSLDEKNRNGSSDGAGGWGEKNDGLVTQIFLTSVSWWLNQPL